MEEVNQILEALARNLDELHRFHERDADRALIDHIDNAEMLVARCMELARRLAF